ncbi:hypothetical protein NC651_024823 [Populus alba x Populus x berolinensis]|nr:hypothetical protein NC651_024818 [Populus alba x Populus x berolinensis]KAJ6891440.1 hypothetical protein NC651_024823 [Populus alba x Populus x berolinensis]
MGRQCQYTLEENRYNNHVVSCPHRINVLPSMQPGSLAAFQLSTGKGLFLSRGLVRRRPNKVTPAPMVFR